MIRDLWNIINIVSFNNVVLPLKVLNTKRKTERGFSYQDKVKEIVISNSKITDLSLTAMFNKLKFTF